MKKGLVAVVAYLLVLGFISCDDSSSGGGAEEYKGDYINIINSYWDGTVNYMGYSNSVTIRIPDASTYIFYVNGYEDDRGTYNRSFNTATLQSNDPRFLGKIVGTAVLTSPNTVYVSLNNNSGYPGATGTATRR